MAARSEAEINSLLVYKSPARQGGVLYSCWQIGQRLTTVVIFVAAVLSRLTRSHMASVASEKEIRLVRRRYLVDEDIAKFRTISEDTSFFESYVRNEKQERTSIDSFDTPSQRRLWQARQFFNEKLRDCSDEEVHRLLGVVERARILVYSVNDPGEATLIFELHNDRGKQLTDLEALKGFLMHSLYLNAHNPEHPLEIIQGHFAKIYRTYEALLDLDGELDEDSVLRYHEDLPGCPARKSGEEWQLVAKRR